MYYGHKLYDINDIKLEELVEYLRKSRSDDPSLTVEEVLEKHEARLNDLTERMFGGKVPDQNVYREVASSETIDGRPEMLRMLKAIESPKVKAIVTVEVQRLSRGDLEDAGRLIKLLKYTNTLVITPERIYDVRDEYDREAFERELKKGNEYLEYFKKIQANGRLDSVSRGNFIGQTPPYGFRKTFIQEGKKKCPILVPHPEEADVVRMIFDMYVNQDMGCTNIAYKLDDLNIKAPKGDHWSTAAITKMLENIHYIGKVKWNYRKTVTIVEDGEIKKTRPVAKVGEYLIYDGKHDAIISEELFNAAQEKKGKNARLKPNVKLRNPLAGLLYCQCGRAMSMRTYKRKDGTERNAPRLLCDGQTYCQTGSALYDEIVQRVCDTLEQCIADFEIRLKNDEGDSVKLHMNLIKNLKKRMADLEEKELAQWEAQSSPNPADRMPQEIFRRLNEKLLKEKEEIQQALCKAYESMPEPVNYEEKILLFSDALATLRNPDASAQEKNNLLKACIERIEYTRERPQRIKSKQTHFYDKEIKKTRYTSPLNAGGNWSNPPIELDVKLKV